MRSLKYRYWKSVIDLRRCMGCKRLQGKIYLPHDFIPEEPPLHPNCRCSIQWLEARTAGTATKLGLRGADWWLKTFRRLPGYYITEDEATQLGWIPILANLAIVAPGKMLTKGVYKNRDKRLPDVPGRIWYEADINYSFGYRGGERILYSNDGLIFATYDHYATFVKIV